MREEFKAEDGTTVILTDDLTVQSHYDYPSSYTVTRVFDRETSTGFQVMHDRDNIINVGAIGQSDAKVRLMIELPPDTEDSDGDS